MNKPLEVHRNKPDAITRKYRLSNRKGIRTEIRWYNVGPGPKKRGWGLFEVK